MSGSMYNCRLCRRTFNSLIDLRNHVRCVHRKANVTADVESDTEHSNGNSEDSLDETEDSEVFTCCLCDKFFVAMENMKLHILDFHKVSLPNSCDDCLQLFRLFQDSKRHICKRKNLDNSSLSQNNSSETVPSHKCSDCKSDFTSKEELQNHSKVHGGHRPYICNRCSDSFSNHEDLVQHLHTKHWKIKRYRCFHCQKSFCFEPELKTHLISCLDEQRYTCRIWLLQYYEESEFSSIPRDELYNHYFQDCLQNKLIPLDRSSLGILLRVVFSGIKTRRLGIRGKSKYHYSGIRCVKYALSRSQRRSAEIYSDETSDCSESSITSQRQFHDSRKRDRENVSILRSEESILRQPNRSNDTRNMSIKQDNFKKHISSLKDHNAMQVKKKADRPTRFQKRCVTCRNCGYAFGTNQRLKLHFLSETCIRNKEQALREKDAAGNYNIESTEKDSIPCDSNDKTMSDHESISEENTVNIEETTDNSNNIELLQCEICDSRFHTDSELKTHLRTHLTSDEFSCGECEGMFSSFEILMEHLKVHA